MTKDHIVRPAYEGNRDASSTGGAARAGSGPARVGGGEAIRHTQPSLEPDLDAISRSLGVKPITSLDDLALDVWESDEELDAFLANLRASRESGLA